MKDFLIVAALAPLLVMALLAVTPHCNNVSPSAAIGGWLVAGCPR